MPKRQNPPHEHLERARTIEATVISLLRGGLWACFVSGLLISIVLVLLIRFGNTSLKSAELPFLLLPSLFLSIASGVFLLMLEPFDYYIANFWLSKNLEDLRSAYELPPVILHFSPRLNQGDLIDVEIAFFYPPGWQTEHNESRINASVGAALSKDFSRRMIVPTFDEVQGIVDPVFDLLAEERRMPVYFTEIRNCFRAPNITKERAKLVV